MTFSAGHALTPVFAAPPQPTFAGYIPSVVTSGQARLIGHHPATDQLTLAIALPLRNTQTLTRLFTAVNSSPHDPHDPNATREPNPGPHLTLSEANQTYNPTPQQEQQIIAWLQAGGLTVTHTYPNHLLVDVSGTFGRIERLLHVTINDYALQQDNAQDEGQTRTFYAPANEPTVDRSVAPLIKAIVGLDDAPSFHVDGSYVAGVAGAQGDGSGDAGSLSSSRLATSAMNGNGSAHGSPPYYPQDFANAYTLNPLWNAGDTGSGQHIGVVLWAPPPSTATLTQFATQTGTAVPSLRLILVGNGHYTVPETVAEEAGMDVEYTSGMAPGATIDYYEAPTTTHGDPIPNGLDDALNLAGTDANTNIQISNSWGECEPSSATDPFVQATEQILQSNTLTGHGYVFSSGDRGSACVPNANKPCSFSDPLPQYPASSAYVTSVGGTRFKSAINGGYPGEVAWQYTASTCSNGSGHPPTGSGGGYSRLFARPGWQTSFSTNAKRAVPDVAADGDHATGAYVCYDRATSTVCIAIGGTSLAAPLWAGMLADLNQYVQSKNEPSVGFITPLLYEMAKGLPHAAYHDIQQGTNGHYQTGAGWDAVTGLGSPNIYNLARDAADVDSPTSYLRAVAAISPNDVWAVGDSYYATITEHWNGSSWRVIPSPNAGGDDSLLGVAAISSNDVWAVGYSYDLHGVRHTLIEHWNGSSWQVIPSPNRSASCPGSFCNTLSSVAAIASNDVWAVGDYYDPNGNQFVLTEHWDGSSWHAIPAPNPGPTNGCLHGDGSPPTSCNDLSGVSAVSTTDVWAVGNFVGAQSVAYSMTEHWNGSSWRVMSTQSQGAPTLNGVKAITTGNVWAVGSSDNVATQIFGTFVERWNGSSWRVVTSPNPPSQDYAPTFRGVAASSASDAWAVGDYETDINAGLFGGLTEHWDGSSWKVVANPQPGYGSFIAGVATIATNNAWAVGDFQDSAGYGRAMIQHWNGSSWTVFWQY